jgi:hypothetical protein
LILSYSFIQKRNVITEFDHAKQRQITMQRFSKEIELQNENKKVKWAFSCHGIAVPHRPHGPHHSKETRGLAAQNPLPN